MENNNNNNIDACPSLLVDFLEMLTQVGAKKAMKALGPHTRLRGRKRPCAPQSGGISKESLC